MPQKTTKMGWSYATQNESGENKVEKRAIVNKITDKTTLNAYGVAQEHV